MRILCVADIHGRRKSLDAAIDKFEKEDFDLFIQLGDLEDSFDRPDEDIAYCLERILEFKLANMDKVILLLGNHAGNYLPFGTTCSGLRAAMLDYIKTYYKENLHHFQMAWACHNYLITHAGVGKLWLESLESKIPPMSVSPQTATEVAVCLNQLLNTEDAPLLFEMGVDSNGRAPQGSPVWLRPAEAYRHDILPGIHQIVGHTPHKQIRVYRQFRYYGPVADRSITGIDILGTWPYEFYSLNIE